MDDKETLAIYTRDVDCLLHLNYQKEKFFMNGSTEDGN